MTTQVTTPSRQQHRRGVRTQLVMTAITLAAIGVLALRLVPDSGDETAMSVTGSTAQSRTTEGAIPIGRLAEQHRENQRGAAALAEERTSMRDGLAERFAERVAAERAATRTIYIVESQERAAAIGALGISPLDGVVWFDSVEAEARFQRALLETNRLREDEAVRAISMIDLRGRQDAPCSGQTVRAEDLIRLACP